MNKEKLFSFLDKVSLGENVEAIKIVSDEGGLHTNFRSSDKTLIGEISFFTLRIESGEYGINDIPQFRKMLNVLDDEIEVVPIKHGEKVISLSVSDKKTESFCMLADLSVIPDPLKVTEPKSYDVEIPITEDFISRFIKANGAIAKPNVPTLFTLMMDKKGKLELVIGYDIINSNRVRIDIEPISGKDKLEDMMNFNSDYFREILAKNRGTTGAVFKVDEEGLGTIVFTTPEYTAKYYMTEKNIDD